MAGTTGTSRALAGAREEAGLTGPPIDDWSDEAILRELARLLRDLPGIDAEETRRRLARLTDDQRFVLEGALERLADDHPAGGLPINPFSSVTAAALERLRREQGCHWEITLSPEDASGLADPAEGSPATRLMTWTCILRWPDRVARGEGSSAEMAMRAALRAAGVTEEPA